MLSLTSSPCTDDELVCNTAMSWTDNEDVAKVATGPQMFQLYHHGDRG